jgi:Fic family protein
MKESRGPLVTFVKDLEQSSLGKDEWGLLKTFVDESERFFTRKELEKLTHKAPRTLSRYLEKLVKGKELNVVGHGPNTRYCRNPEKD